MGEKVKNIIILVLIILLIPILFINTWIVIKSFTNKDKVPDFLGYKPFVVLSGSMETEIYTGDLALVREVNTKELKVGDVIAFKEDEVVIVHRIVEIEDTSEGQVKYTTKGDNNEMRDDNKVEESQVEGIYLYKLSGVGNIVMFIQTPLGFIISVSIPIILIIIIQMSSNKKYKEELERLQKEVNDKKASKK